MNNLNHHISSQESNKPWLVLIHGLFGSLDNLAVIRRGFEHTHNVLSVDLPDHGSSYCSSVFSFSEYAQSIINLMDTLNINECRLLGHSLGGKVAMKIALTHSERIEKLLIADIAPVAYSPRHHNVINGLSAVKLDEITTRGEATKIMSSHIVEAGVIQFLLKSLYKGDDGWQWRFNLQLLIRDYSRLSEAIEADNQYSGPTLFLKGGQSDYLLPEHKSAIDKLFPNSKAKIIGSAGHWLHSQKPDLFNRLVADFL